MIMDHVNLYEDAAKTAFGMMVFYASLIVIPIVFGIVVGIVQLCGVDVPWGWHLP